MEDKLLELPMLSDDNTITIGEHTLFVEDIEDDSETVMMPIHGKQVPVNIEGDKHKKYTLYLGDFQGEKLHKIIQKLREASEDDIIEIRISSNGGDIDNILILMNTIREKFSSITTVIEANAYSAGAMIFLIGDIRIAYHNVSYMVHGYSTGYGGKGGEIKSYIDYTDAHINKLFKEMFVDKGYISDNEFKDMKKGTDFWIDTKGLADRGISTHTIYENALLSNDAYIKWCNYNGKKSFDEWIEMMIKKIEKDSE